MRVGIIGGGVVGQATAKSFIEHVDEVRVYDMAKERSTHETLDVLECDVVFVCLPTPQNTGSMECDLSALHSFFSQCQTQNCYYPDRLNLVLRSTVPVGTTCMLREKYNLSNLVHSPEFLTARCATLDAQMPTRNIIGDTGDRVGQFPCSILLGQLYKQRWPHVPLQRMTSDESESVKLMLNSFFATKVGFWNEMRSFADKMGLDWDRVMSGILTDGRIHPSHTKVPGPDGKKGFGGTCLPKDLADMIDCMEKAGLSAPVCRAAYHRNELDRS